MSRQAHIVWTFVITSIAFFMTTLDNLVVTTALPTMQRDLHASISGLEWTVNAYTLTFAVLLMLGAAVGDRLRRKRVFLPGLGVAIGPLVGGAVVQGLSWQWIFWLNVPIGLAAIPLGLSRLRESHGPAARLDVTGVGLVTGAALGLVWGLVRANSRGWTSPEIVASLAAGFVLLVAFVAWERRSAQPMLPMRLFR